MVYTGTIKDSRGERPIEIIIQNPGWIRITEGGTSARITTFDGVRVLSPSGNLAADQAKLLQTIALDVPETLFNQFAAGEPFRSIDSNAKVKQTDANAPAEFVDLFQMISTKTAPKLAVSAAPRFVAFESTTGYLRYVGHVDSGGVKVLSQFEGWKTANREAFPSTIRRLENGVEVFRISIETLAVGSRLAAGAF